MSTTQPTEAHRKLWTALYNLAHREIFEDFAESSEGPATRLIAESEAKAVERALAIKPEVIAYPGLEMRLTAEREKVRVLREALAALLGDEWRMSCDWGPASEREPITVAARAALAATEEKP
jgi:hypothetical protein